MFKKTTFLSKNALKHWILLPERFPQKGNLPVTLLGILKRTLPVLLKEPSESSLWVPSAIPSGVPSKVKVPSGVSSEVPSGVLRFLLVFPSMRFLQGFLPKFLLGFLLRFLLRYSNLRYWLWGIAVEILKNEILEFEIWKVHLRYEKFIWDMKSSFEILVVWDMGTWDIEFQNIRIWDIEFSMAWDIESMWDIRWYVRYELKLVWDMSLGN